MNTIYSRRIITVQEDVQQLFKHWREPTVTVGLAAAPTATHWCDVDVLTPFVATSGNGVFGADPNDEALVVGSADTPVVPAWSAYNFKSLLVTAATDPTTWLLRLIWGTGTMSDAETAGQYSETCYIHTAAPGRGHPVEVNLPQMALGTKIWVRAMNVTDNATISFLALLHGR